MKIEVTYATPKKQALIEVTLKDNTTVRDAIYLSGILDAFPEIDLSVNQIGIFSEKTDLSQRVNDGDRIEIYRPLIIDPKQARRLRAQRKMKKLSS